MAYEELLEDDALVSLKNSGLFYEKNLVEEEIPADIIKLISKSIVSQYQVIPVELMDSGLLLLVTSSPEALKYTTQLQIS